MTGLVFWYNFNFNLLDSLFFLSEDWLFLHVPQGGDLSVNYWLLLLLSYCWLQFYLLLLSIHFYYLRLPSYLCYWPTRICRTLYSNILVIRLTLVVRLWRPLPVSRHLLSSSLQVDSHISPWVSLPFISVIELLLLLPIILQYLLPFLQQPGQPVSGQGGQAGDLDIPRVPPNVRPNREHDAGVTFLNTFGYFPSPFIRSPGTKVFKVGHFITHRLRRAFERR